MRAFFESVNEKDRRRYAAIEARKLGYGGPSYIACIVGCERHSIALDLAELNDQEALSLTGIRRLMENTTRHRSLSHTGRGFFGSAG